jgi:hypothetical protein
MGTSVLGIFYEEDFPSRLKAGLRTRKIGVSSRHGQKSLLWLGREKPGVGQVSPSFRQAFRFRFLIRRASGSGWFVGRRETLRERGKGKIHWARDRL